MPRTKSPSSCVSAAAAYNGTSANDTNALLRAMHEELTQLRAAQTSANEEMRQIRQIQDDTVARLRGELGNVMRQSVIVNRILSKMETTQRRLVQRLDNFERPGAGTTPSPLPTSEPTGSQPSTTRRSRRLLRREGAFWGLRDLQNRDLYSDVSGYGGDAPESAPHCPTADSEEEGNHSRRRRFPTSSTRTGDDNGNGSGSKKRTRDDVDPPTATSSRTDDDESVQPPSKRRRAMNGERVRVDPTSAQPPAGDMPPPPRPDTPRPGASPASYIRGIVATVVSSVLP